MISVPLELVSAASRTVTPPPGGLVKVVVSAAQRRDHDAQGVGQARWCLLGVDVAAKDLEDRCPRIGRVGQRRDADLLDHQRDARDARRTVAPAADGKLGMDVGDRRLGVGVREGRQHEQARVLPLNRREVARSAGQRADR